MTVAIPKHVNGFLNQTRVAVISTVDADGKPRSTPIWYHWEDGAPYMFTNRRTLKWRNLRRTPYASLCIDSRKPPYESVILSGAVEEVSRPLYDLVLSMSLRYYERDEALTFAEGYRGEHPNIVIFRLVPQRVADYTKGE